MNTWFEVDKEGLAKLLRRRGMRFVLFELLQNCYDTNATKVEVTLQPSAKRGVASISVVDDDPNGFANLTHAYTLFAESTRKGDPNKRGRFNLGEKLILAVCDEAEVRSTTGTVMFNTGRHHSRKKRESGTEFYGLVRMTKAELADVIEAVDTILPPIETVINGTLLKPRVPIHEFTAALPTEISDDEGILRPTIRKTNIRIYERNGTSRLYEMGIPVVDTEDPWDIEIMQKVPLNADRDNVTPAYLRDVRVKVLNEMHTRLRAEEASLPSVLSALPTASPEAVNSVLTHQYGEKRAIFDMSDPEANRVLQSQGYQIIAGGSFPKEAWENIKASGSAKPSGQIAPTYKPYSEGGEPAQLVHPSAWTPAMKNIADYIWALAPRILSHKVTVLFEKGRFTAPFAANYGHYTLTFNLDRLGKKWFEAGRKNPKINELIIHELSHQYGQHLTKEFDDALAEIGAKMVALALMEPDLFEDKNGK